MLARILAGVIESLAWLGLQVDDLERATEYYRELLGSPETTSSPVTFQAGSSSLHLKQPGADPPGGEHVHYAFSVPREAYQEYRERLKGLGAVEEHQFGPYRSAYGFDPDEHCVEIAGRDEHGTGITGIFEIVLAVENLENAMAWYENLDTDVMDRGTNRRRVRLDLGPFELELWEPQRGIADARPGAHVDLGLFTNDVDAVVDRLRPGAREITTLEGGSRVLDADGHTLTMLEA